MNKVIIKIIAIDTVRKTELLALEKVVFVCFDEENFSLYKQYTESEKKI